MMTAARSALQSRNYTDALGLLLEAEKIDASHPDLHFNKSVAFRQIGDQAQAMISLDRALSLQPYHLPATLAKASLLEELGRKQEAANYFRTALTIAPEIEKLPPGMAKSMQRAAAAVEADNAQLRDVLLSQIEKLHAKFGKNETRRFDECMQIFTGRGKRYFPEPTLLYFPQLPVVSYFDRFLFPWIEKFEAATPDIQQELRAILNSPTAGEFSPYINYPPGAPVNQWRDLNKSTRWSTYFFWKDGEKNEDAYRLAPKTGAAIDLAPLFDARGFGPAAFFSSLAGHAHIPPHVGSSNVRSIVHLPLELPGPAWFRVGNERREWRIGEAFVFDDSIDHEAKNDAAETRTILILDVWNPYLSEAERELVSILLSTTHHYRLTTL